MATFRIDTPDGKSFEITGDHTPSEQELSQMFGNQMPEQKDNALDTAAGALSSFSRGATLGLGDKAGGLINAIGSYLPDRAIEAITGNKMPTFADRYNEIVQDADKKREDFANAHPVANFGLEAAGNIAGAGTALYKGAGKLGLKGLKALAASGATEGGIQAASDTDNLGDLPQNVALGTAIGGAMPIAMNYALKPAARLVQPLTKGNVPDKQIIYDKSYPANKAVVNRNDTTGEINVVTGMKDRGLNKELRGSGVRTGSPYAVDSNATKPAVVRFSAFRTSYKDNIAPNAEKVNNSFGVKSFVDALADKDKSRKMRNAVMAGADELAEKARVLQDAIVRREAGMYDEGLENLVKTDSFKRAEAKYNEFMTKNGNNSISTQKVNEFYGQHPVAQGMIDEMRVVDPRAFDGVKRGSLKEFDLLKQALRTEAGQNITVGASRKGALKRAENALKALMDKEFKGFKDVNTNFADARTGQEIFESKLKKGLNAVGGATSSPFWTGISSPLTAAGVVGGVVNPLPVILAGAGLSGKALMRAYRRNLGRDIANGVIKTSANVNPLISLSSGNALGDEIARRIDIMNKGEKNAL